MFENTARSDLRSLRPGDIDEAFLFAIITIMMSRCMLEVSRTNYKLLSSMSRMDPQYPYIVTVILGPVLKQNAKR